VEETKDCMAYLFKARTVEPEKRQLLANSSELRFDSRQRLGKNIPAATDTHAKIEVLLETVFLRWPVPRIYKEDNWGNQVSSVRDSVKKSDSLKGAVAQRGLESEDYPLLETVTRQRLVRHCGIEKQRDFVHCGNRDSVIVIRNYDL
jgi:hypothetical protein